MDLESLRHELDGVNDELLRLFCRRMELVQDVARVKLQNGLPVYHPEREREIIERITQNTEESLKTGARVLFQTLMDISKSSQYARLSGESGGESPLSSLIEDALLKNRALPKSAAVACQGIAGAYSHEAARTAFAEPEISFFPGFEDAFRAVAGGACEFAVLPADNSNHGSVGEVYDLLRRYKLYVCHSLKLPVSHCLLAKKGAAIEDITEIYSHEQALGQCGEFLRSRPGITPKIAANTALAARQLAEGESLTAAAIASRECAELYNLVVLRERLQGERRNFTRFIVLSREPVIEPEASRVSFSLTLSHTAGALYRLITRFAVLSLSLTKIESRPLPDSDFSFVFYFEFEGSVRDRAVRELLCSLAREHESFRFQGNYSEGGVQGD